MVLVHLASLADSSQSPLGALYAGTTEEKGHEMIERELANLITSHPDLMPHGDPYPAKVSWTNRGRPLQYVENEQSGTFAKCAASGLVTCACTSLVPPVALTLSPLPSA